MACYLGGRNHEDWGYRSAWGKSKTLSQKSPTEKRAGGVPQMDKW